MKWLTLAIILSLVVVITGCGGGQTTGKSFIGGTESVTASFLAGNPPETVVDGDRTNFGIVIKLENVGETDIKDNEGYIQIQGLDQGVYSPDNSGGFKRNIGDLRGAKKNFDGTVLNGATGTVEFTGLSYGPSIQGDLQQTVWADICYKYGTKAVSQLCIKSDTEQILSDKKICEVEGEKKPENSAGPIQITSLKQSFAGTGKMALTVVVTHSGKTGNTFYNPTENMCNDVESNGQRGKVKVDFKNIQIGGRSVPVECTGLDSDKTIRLYKDGTGKETATLYCTIDTSSASNVVEVPIEAELTYKYMQNIQKPITIRHVAR